MIIRLFACILLVTSGCGLVGKKVRVFERQYLSEKGMPFVENPGEDASIQHMLNAREGSVGGFGRAGGGCGCN